MSRDFAFREENSFSVYSINISYLICIDNKPNTDVRDSNANIPLVVTNFIHCIYLQIFPLQGIKSNTDGTLSTEHWPDQITAITSFQ